MRTPSNLSPRTLLWFLTPAAVSLTSMPAVALDPFIDGSAQLNNPALASGVAIGIADMNSDGLDDIVRFDEASSLEIEYQEPDGTFRHFVYGVVPGYHWGMALGDLDRNGYLDIFTGGAFENQKVLLASDDGRQFDLTQMVEPAFTQCANFADIDNNGTLDLFVCDDEGLSLPYNNDGTGVMTYDPSLIAAVSTIPSDNSGNYGSVWTDYDSDGDLDLYIAKCRVFVTDPLDGRRVNLLFENDGDNNFTDVAERVGLRPLAQSWSMDFADIDNDGDMDAFIVNHDMLSQLYENQGPGADAGQFIDITAAAGMTDDLTAVDLGIQAHFEDFDNDTLVDLLVTASNGGEHRLFMNNGDHTFTAAIDVFPTDGLNIQSAVVGDLNDDGAPDILAGFATGYNQPSIGNPDRLLLNPGNENNWLKVRLTGLTSNSSAVGARIELVGAWGTQVREIRAGEGYGITNSLIPHFGLGTAETIESIVVRWPSGHVNTIDNPAVLNETINITEGCPNLWYADLDQDGFGDPRRSTGGCLPPAGYVPDASDCNDGSAAQFPGNAEICDELDNDCNGEVDEPAGEVCVGSDSTGADSASSSDSDSGDDTTGQSSGAGPVDPSSPLTSGPSDPTNGGSSEGTGDLSAGAGGGDQGGCTCEVSDSAPSRGLPVLLLGMLLSLRRRRLNINA